MTNTEILEKAIQKAIDGGWKQEWLLLHGNTKNKDEVFKKWLHNVMDGYDGYRNIYYDYDEFICISEIIFNHDFAKALWGEEIIDWVNDFDSLCFSKWQSNLMKMVISEDPIKYLGDNI